MVKKAASNPTINPTRRAIEACAREPLHIARNNTKADVYRLEWPPDSGQFAVLKDMKGRPAWFRLSAGRWFLAREFRALRALEGTAGVPRALARPDADAILMEWRAGTPVLKRSKDDIPVEAVEAIARTVAQAHARGVIHGDLHRSNVLMADDRQITLIDWATAGVFGAKRRGLKTLTFEEWRVLDLRSVAKIKARYAPHCLSDGEKEILLNGSRLYRLVRGIGFQLRKMLGQQRAQPPELTAARYQHYIERAAKPKDETP